VTCRPSRSTLERMIPGALRGPLRSPSRPIDGSALLPHCRADHTISSGPRHPTPRRHAGAVWVLAFCPDGRSLASARVDGMLRPWDVRQIEVPSPSAEGGQRAEDR
jgi:hypothetical protein